MFRGFLFGLFLTLLPFPSLLLKLREGARHSKVDYWSIAREFTHKKAPCGAFSKQSAIINIR